MSGYVTVSIGSGLVDSIYGNCQVPIKSFLEKQGEAFEQESLLKVLFRMQNSNHWAEAYGGETAMENFMPVGEGGAYPTTGFQEGHKQTIENEEWKQSFSVTQTLVEDNQLGTMKSRANKLITAYHRTREEFGRAMYAGALKGTQVTFGGKTFKTTSADGQPLFSKSHANKVDKKVQTNLYAGEFTAEALDAVETNMQNAKGENGQLLAIAPDTILIPNDAVLKRKVFEVIGADKDPDTSNNGFNYQYGRWNVICDPYLTLALSKLGITDKPWILLDSKFIQDNDGAIFQNRINLQVKSEIDSNNDNNVWKGRARFSAGFVDWRFAAAGGVTGGTAL
jgi:hypothetical protein